MPNKPLPYYTIKQIINLHIQDESLRSIADYLGISRESATKYVSFFKSSGLSYDAIKNMTSEEIYKLIVEFPKKDN
jgi:hypothetical protein